MRASLRRLLDLQELISAFSAVERRAHRKHANGYRQESDTEHSYGLAMTAWFLAQYFPDLDKDKIIRYALVHDLVEVFAGDTFSYGSQEELDSKERREAEAASRLLSEWPDFEGVHQAIEAYEKREDAESRFVYALDKLIPVMMIYANDGYSWQVHDVTVDMIRASKVDKVSLSPEVKPYFDELHDLLLSRPDLISSV